MLSTAVIRRALPVCALAIFLGGAPAAAFQPSVVVRAEDPGDDLAVTDLDAHGDNVSVGSTIKTGAVRAVMVDHTNDGGVTWSGQILTNGVAVREPETTVCAGRAVIIYRADVDDPATQWIIESFSIDLATNGIDFIEWKEGGKYRKPDVACVANAELAAAWFQEDGSGWDVKLKVQVVEGDDPSSQSFNLASGTLRKGLAIATSATRLYVAWFRGDELKLRRFSIGGGPSHHLTSLGTATIATLPDGMYPEIGADGDRVILAYMDRADLKVRRSTDKGLTWGSAKTLRDEPFPSEIGAYPMTVGVEGSKVAIGAVEISDVGGKGLGYLSTNGGSSYTKVSSHSSGPIVAGLVKIGSSHKYAEAWDQSISDPDPEIIRYRRQ